MKNRNTLEQLSMFSTAELNDQILSPSARLAKISALQENELDWMGSEVVLSSTHLPQLLTSDQVFISGKMLREHSARTLWFLPQNRERIFLVGRIAGQCTGQVFPIGENDGLFEQANKTGKRRTQAEYCSTIEENFGGKADDTFIVSYTRDNKGSVERYNLKGTANTITSATGGTGNTSQFIITDARVRSNEKERNYTKYSPTITSLYGTGGNNVPIVNRIRRLTEIECERLQGLPDDWTKFGNYDGTIKEIPMSQRYKLLGNGVTVKVVEEIGKNILKNTEI